MNFENTSQVWADETIPISVQLAQSSFLAPLVNSILTEARALKLPLETVVIWASKDLISMLQGERPQLPANLAPLLPYLQSLILRNSQLLRHVLLESRPLEFLRDLLIFEVSQDTPVFSNVREISDDRATAAFRRAAAVARGDSPIKKPQRSEKARKVPKPVEEDVELPVLIELDGNNTTSLPTVEELMNEHGLSRKGALTVLARLGTE